MQVLDNEDEGEANDRKKQRGKFLDTDKGPVLSSRPTLNKNNSDYDHGAAALLIIMVKQSVSCKTSISPQFEFC